MIVAVLQPMEQWLDALTPFEHMMFHLLMIGLGFVVGALVCAWLRR